MKWLSSAAERARAARVLQRRGFRGRIGPERAAQLVDEIVQAVNYGAPLQTIALSPDRRFIAVRWQDAGWGSEIVWHYLAFDGPMYWPSPDDADSWEFIYKPHPTTSASESKGWFRREFERARKRSESVPPRARPILIKKQEGK